MDLAPKNTLLMLQRWGDDISQTDVEMCRSEVGMVLSSLSLIAPSRGVREPHPGWFRLYEDLCSFLGAPSVAI